MHDEDPASIRSDLLDRLRAMDSTLSQSDLPELAYARAREAITSALEEARTIRLQAIDDARLTRERELAALLEALRALRQSAESQIESILRTAELEAERVRERAANESRTYVERATAEARQIHEDTLAIRSAAEQRLKETERLEAEFNKTFAELAGRIGITEQPAEGWWQRMSRLP